MHGGHVAALHHACEALQQVDHLVPDRLLHVDHFDLVMAHHRLVAGLQGLQHLTNTSLR